MFPSNIFANFSTEGQILASVIGIYALHLLWLLGLIELATIAITYMMESENPSEIGWRIIRFSFTFGFAWWWISNAWVRGITVLNSFRVIGEQLTGVGALTPTQQFWNTGFAIVKTMWEAPSSSSAIPNPAVALGVIIMAIVILVMFTAVTVVCLFFMTGALLLIGPGSFFVSFMPCRWLSTLSENYFIWLIRMGAGLLGFYIVLFATKDLAGEWSTALNGACHPVAATIRVPMAGGAPTIFHSAICTQPIPLDILFDTFCDMLILAFLGIGIPFMMAAFAGGGVHMALEHFAAAKYVGGSAMHYLGSAIGGLTHVVQRMAQNSSQQTTLQQRMEAGAAAARASSGTPTTPLTPPPSSGGGWNGRPAGPPIAPPPSGPHNSGPGGSPAGLTYYPGRPGAQTKAEAVDITKLQKR
jgi:type IV secretory pathway TrbL component